MSTHPTTGDRTDTETTRAQVRDRYASAAGQATAGTQASDCGSATPPAVAAPPRAGHPALTPPRRRSPAPGSIPR
jgi:hypothetical protein